MEQGCPRTARTLPCPLLPATVFHQPWLQSLALHPLSISEGKLSRCQAPRASLMNKAIQEILPFLFLYLLKYIQSSSICFSSHSSYGYQVTVVPPSLFVFFLLSDIPVGSPNGPSAWGDACSVSRAGLEDSIPPPAPATRDCCRHWHRSLGKEGQRAGAAAQHSPAGGEGKDHAAKESSGSVHTWARTCAA